jgi:hypothetical protein
MTAIDFSRSSHASLQERGTDPVSSASGMQLTQKAHHGRRLVDDGANTSEAFGSLCDLYPSLDRRRAQSGVQLTRRPVCCLGGIHPKPSSCWLDANTKPIRRWRLLGRFDRPTGSSEASRGCEGRQARHHRRLQGRPPHAVVGRFCKAGGAIRPTRRHVCIGHAAI